VNRGGGSLMQSLVVMTITLWKNFFRDRQSIFFSLIFPLVFLLIFGFMYADQTMGPRNPVLAVFEDGGTDQQAVLQRVLENAPGLNFDFFDEAGIVEERVVSGQASFGLIADSGELNFLFNPTRIQDNAHLESLAGGIRSSFEREQAGVQEVIVVKTEGISGPGGATSPLEFIIPGTIAIAVVASGLFAITGFYLSFLERGVLRRMLATPLRKEVFFLGLILTRIIVAIIGAVLILIASRLLFGISLEIHWAFFLPYLMVATLLMMALGVLITLVFKKRENANQFSSFLVSVMIFFSGIYLPLEFLPDYLQTISRFLPLTYVAQGLRGTMGIEPFAPGDFWISFLTMLIIALFFISLAARGSRWGEQGA